MRVDSHLQPGMGHQKALDACETGLYMLTKSLKLWMLLFRHLKSSVNNFLTPNNPIRGFVRITPVPYKKQKLLERLIPSVF